MDAVTTKIIGYLVLVGAVCIAWAATKVSANASNGDVRSGANSGIVTFIAIFLFAAAGAMAVISGFMTGLINDIFR